MILNPRATLHLPRDEVPIGTVAVRAPVRGEGLRLTRVTREAEPELFRWLLFRALGRSPDADVAGLPEPQRARLADLGYLVTPERVSRPVLFRCDLDAAPDSLLPPRLRRRPEASPPAGTVVVNPTLRRLTPEETPSPPLADDRAWVELDAGFAVPAVCSIPPHLGPLLDAVVPGARPPALPADRAAGLRRAGVLVTPAELEARRRATAGALEAAAAALAGTGHAVVRDAAHPLQVAAVRRYYRDLVAEGHLQFGDAEWPLRYFGYGEPLARFFHRRLVPLLGRVTGQPVKPSFLYVASYRPGADLRPHTDREQCEWSVSWLVDHDPEPDPWSPWPICFGRPGPEAVPVHLGVGDLAVYRGRAVTHFRDPMPAGLAATLCLPFFVPADFDGSLA